MVHLWFVFSIAVLLKVDDFDVTFMFSFFVLAYLLFLNKSR